MPRVALLLALALAACDWPPAGSGGDAGVASGGTPPSAAVIDSLDLSSNAQALNGYYNIYGSISFHDDQVAVHAIRMRIPVLGTKKTYDFDVGDLKSVIGDPIDLVVSADVPLGGAGETTVEISLVDVDGGETQPPMVKQVDLQ